MSDHTPTPWKNSPNSFGTQFIYGDLETPLQTPMGVSYFHLVAGGDHPSTLTEVDAAFIVKAVNNHDALVLALHQAKAFLVIDQLSPAVHAFEIERRTAYRNMLVEQIGAALTAVVGGPARG